MRRARRGRRQCARARGAEKQEKEIPAPAAAAAPHAFRRVSACRLEPLQPFSPRAVRRRARDALGSFRGMRYQHETCGQVARAVANQLLELTKQLAFPRYKYVVQVSVGEKQGQAVWISSRALWDHRKDSFITLTYQNTHLFAVATVFAVYME